MVSKNSDRILGVRAPRRTVLKGATGAAAGMAAFGVVREVVPARTAQDDIRTQILAIPGVGARQPTEDDMARVGELCLEPTKANVQQGEFNGVSSVSWVLTTRTCTTSSSAPLLQSWEEYTGASIEWIDLAQADYNPRLQQAIATGTVDFDVTRDGSTRSKATFSARVWHPRCRTGSTSRST